MTEFQFRYWANFAHFIRCTLTPLRTRTACKQSQFYSLASMHCRKLILSKGGSPRNAVFPGFSVLFCCYFLEASVFTGFFFIAPFFVDFSGACPILSPWHFGWKRNTENRYSLEKLTSNMQGLFWFGSSWHDSFRLNLTLPAYTGKNLRNNSFEARLACSKVRGFSFCISFFEIIFSKRKGERVRAPRKKRNKPTLTPLPRFIFPHDFPTSPTSIFPPTFSPSSIAPAE